MARDIKAFINKKVLDGKSRKHKAFVSKHSVENEDPNQHNNDVSRKMKMSNRNPLHGYNPGQDERVYESLKPSKAALKAALKKEVAKNSNASGDNFQPTNKSSRLIKKINENQSPFQIGKIGSYTVKKVKEHINPDNMDDSEIYDHDGNDGSHTEYHIHKDGKKVGHIHKDHYYGQISGTLHNKDLPDLSGYGTSHSSGVLSTIHSFLKSRTGKKWASNLHKYNKINEGKIGKMKDKDIENQELATQYKRFYADSPNITDDGKKLVKKKIKQYTKEDLDNLYEDWTEHRSRHGSGAINYAQKIQGLCQQLHDLCDNEYEGYDLKDLHRRLEDMYEELDKNVCRKKKYKDEEKKWKGNTAQSPYPLVKEETELEEGIVRKVKRFMTAGSIKKNLSNKADAEQRKVHADLEQIPRGVRWTQNDKKLAKRSSTLGRRISAMKPDGDGNFFMPEWPRSPKELGYMKGLTAAQKAKMRLREETELEEGLGDTIWNVLSLRRRGVKRKLQSKSNVQRLMGREYIKRSRASSASADANKKFNDAATGLTGKPINSPELWRKTMSLRKDAVENSKKAVGRFKASSSLSRKADDLSRTKNYFKGKK